MAEVGQRLRFLIANKRLYINTVPSNLAPPHFDLSYLLGLVAREVAKKVMAEDVDNRPSLAMQLFGRSLLGGYCQMVNDNPPKYVYVSGAQGITAASEKEFKAVNKPKTTTYSDAKTDDVFKTDLYRLN